MVVVRERRIPVLPNLITTGSIFCGFYSVIHSIQGAFIHAAWALVVATVFDVLDGRVARLTNTQSEFGGQYDSLSDLISFGLAPAVLAYLWGLEYFGRLGWLAAFLYVVCAALRLARFNVQAGTKEKDYFQGLPSPAGAFVIIGTVLFDQQFGGEGTLAFFPAKIGFLAITFAVALLMVSGFRYRTFKYAGIRGVRPFTWLVLAALIITFVMLSPEAAIFSMAYGYLIFGIVETLFFLRKGVKEVLEQGEEEDEESDEKSKDFYNLLL